MNLGSRKEGFYMSHARKPYAELSNASLKDQEHLGVCGQNGGSLHLSICRKGYLRELF